MHLPRPWIAGAAAAALPLVGCSVTVQIDDGRWTAHCVNVSADDCLGVAELFTNNLAWGEGWAHDESGGFVQVGQLVPCPVQLPDFIVQGTCWRAKWEDPGRGARVRSAQTRSYGPRLLATGWT